MTGRNSLDALTGLRFVAAFCVLIHHAIGTNPTIKNLNLPLGNGAVSFFFVLSGFILTYAYNGRLNSWADIRLFWYTRWARIWPLHLVCLIFSVLATMGFYQVFNHAAMTSRFLSNLALLQCWIPDYAWGFSFNQVSWSISDEAFFYLIFPLLFLLSTRRFAWVSGLCIGVILVIVGLIQQLARDQALPTWFDPIAFVHLNPAIRSFDFLVGMVAGRIFITRQAANRPLGFVTGTAVEWVALGLLGIVWWFALSQYPLFFVKKSPYLGDVIANWLRFSGYAISFAIIIHVFARSQGRMAQLMSTPVMVYLGEISYSLYMCHALTILVLKKTVPQTLAAVNGLTLLLVATVSILVSVFLYQMVELPAKAGLLALYHQNYRRSLTEVMRIWRGFLTSPLAWIALGLSVASWLLIKNLS